MNNNQLDALLFLSLLRLSGFNDGISYFSQNFLSFAPITTAAHYLHCDRFSDHM
jgi:hypothetical protein